MCTKINNVYLCVISFLRKIVSIVLCQTMCTDLMNNVFRYPEEKLDEAQLYFSFITLLHFSFGVEKEMIGLGTVLNSLSESVVENFVAPLIIFQSP